MVSPEWFFSTLAQSTAAAIGFVIAFTASVYTLRNSIFQERVSEFRRDVGLLHTTYGPLFEATWEYLATEANFDSDTEVYLNANSEAGKWAETQPDQVSAEVWAILKMISATLSRIPEERDPEQIQIAFEMIEEPIQRLIDILDYESEHAKHLVYELTGENPEERDITKISIFRQGHAARRKFRRSSDSDVGRIHRLRGFQEVVEDFQTDYDELIRRRGTEWLTERPSGSIEVLSQSLKLFGIGVLLPIVFLLTLPAEISSILLETLNRIHPDLHSYLILSSQILILVLVGYQTQKLYKSLKDLIFYSKSGR